MTRTQRVQRHADATPTVGQALAGSTRRLPGDRAALEARMLLAHLLECDPGWLIAHADERLSARQWDRLDGLLARRLMGEPMAYLIGRRAFYDVDLTITPDVLIPRPESELLVDVVLELLVGRREARIADLGTGSAALAVALARALPDAQIWASDLGAQAMRVAATNVARLCPNRVQLLRADWAAPLAASAFDIVVANPPYVASDDAHLLRGDVAFEPRLALDGGRDGLDAYRALLGDAERVLVPGGWLAVEHGFDQARAVRSLLERAGLEQVSCRRDLSGHERVTLAMRARPDAREIGQHDELGDKLAP